MEKRNLTCIVCPKRAMAETCGGRFKLCGADITGDITVSVEEA